MNLTPTTDKQTTKPDMEQVENEKQEYKLIDRILRTPGLLLWAYKPDGEVVEVKIKPIHTLELIPVNGELVPKDENYGDSVIDPRNRHFEALNKRTAVNRVKRWKEGKIKELSNLRFYNPNGIKIF